MIERTALMKRTTHRVQMSTKNHGSSIPKFGLRGSSMYSIWSEFIPPRAVSHMKAAKQGWEWLLPGRTESELFGSKNEGNGGGGMDNIASGG